MTRLALLLLAALSFAPAAHAGNPVLVGQVGYRNAYTITLKTTDGKPVTSLAAGTYTLVVHDYSKVHNFALGSVTGNRRIFTGSVPKTGTKTYTLDLTPGTYAYACSAHPSTMHGTFVVTAPATP